MENFEAPSRLAASLRIVRDYLAFQAVLGMAQLLEQRTKSAWQLQALHTVTWLSSSILFINICYSSWALIGAIAQWTTPPHLLEPFRMDHYNPSPWGPIGAVIEYGLAGELISRLWWNRNAKASDDRLVGRNLAQLLQIRLPVCLRSGHSSFFQSEAQSSASASANYVLVPAVWRDSLLRLIHVARTDTAKQRISVLRAPRCSGGLSSLRV